MNGQVCSHKSVKCFFTPSCRQKISNCPERKCQDIKPHKKWNQRHSPVKSHGKVKMMPVCSKKITSPVDQAISCQDSQKRENRPSGYIFIKKLFSAYPLVFFDVILDEAKLTSDDEEILAKASMPTVASIV